MENKKTCPSCGAVNNANNRFCVSCGFKLENVNEDSDTNILNASADAAVAGGAPVAAPQAPAVPEAEEAPVAGQATEAVEAPAAAAPQPDAVPDAAETSVSEQATEAVEVPVVPPAPATVESNKGKKSKKEPKKPKVKKEGKSGSGRKVWRTILIVFLIIIAMGCGGAAVYYYMQHNGKSSYGDTSGGSSESKDSVSKDEDARVKEQEGSEDGDHGNNDEYMGSDNIRMVNGLMIQYPDEPIDPELVKLRKNKSTHDLTFCDLHGLVNDAYLYENSSQKAHYNFDGDGYLTGWSDTHSRDNMVFDEKNYPVGEQTSWGYITYKWNKGMLSEADDPVEGHKRYIYSSKGELRGIETSNNGISRTETYCDYVYDPYLNWVKRTRISPNGIRYTQTRKINYYNPE